jgi:hypothetical protein
MVFVRLKARNGVVVGARSEALISGIEDNKTTLFLRAAEVS